MRTADCQDWQKTQAYHRQSLEKDAIESNVASQKGGMIYGFILCG